MARSNIIGEVGVENYISGNGTDGIAIYYSSANRIAGNFIGLTASGTLLAIVIGTPSASLPE
jgi:parallel beta-helix repeat protein